MAGATDNDNTFIGYNSATAANGSGSGTNTIVGASAAGTLTTGVGNVCVGKSANVSTGAAAGQFTIGVSVACDQDNQITIGNASGTMKNEFDTDATWTQASDERLKDFIGDSPLGLSFINRLVPKTYTWKPMHARPEELITDVHAALDTKTVMTGLSAQAVRMALDLEDVEKFAAWSVDPNGQQRISKEMFVFPLINAVNQITQRLEALEGA